MLSDNIGLNQSEHSFTTTITARLTGLKLSTVNPPKTAPAQKKSSYLKAFEHFGGERNFTGDNERKEEKQKHRKLPSPSEMLFYYSAVGV